MEFHRKLFAGAALAALLAFSPGAQAQEGSMQVGNATVSVGGGVAILTLPDVEFTKFLIPGLTLVGRLDDSDDFDDEIGWNVNGSIAVPMVGAKGRPKVITLSGFWANIEDDETKSCTSTATIQCSWVGIVNDPGLGHGNTLASGGASVAIRSERDVDQWGAALESAWQISPDVMGVTQAPNRRYVALGADIRGIDQDLTIVVPNPVTTVGPLSYSEDLDTTYYGAYLAWGGDYSPFLFKGLWQRWGLQSSFQLRGGVYYADTDYDGRYVDASGVSQFTQNLSLSYNNVAFIGGLTLETRKQIGRRAALSLRSEYEYYSYVPDMRYNDIDTVIGITGPNNGTSIGDDDAFSMRTSLRLTIGLGPRDLYQEPAAYK